MFCIVCGCKAQSAHCFRHKPRKAMRKEAVKTKEKRIAVTKRWLDANPPDAYGFWSCYLKISPKCHRKVDMGTLNIEHVKSKARYPGHKFDLANLRASCPECNAMKMSKDLEEFK